MSLIRSFRNRSPGSSGGAAPAFSVAPVIVGTPTVGVASAYTLGTVSGSPTITQQWTLDGTDISGATGSTYTPISGDATHLLRVREIATNGYGSANSTSASATVAGAASPGNFATRSTAAGVVWSHNFSNSTEITAFAYPQVAGGNHAGNALNPFQVADPIVGNAMRIIALGAHTTTALLASGGAGPRSVTIDDPTYWPDPAVAGSYYVHLCDPSVSTQTHNLFLVTAKSGAVLTVTFQSVGGEPFTGTQNDWPVGSGIGHQCATTWYRHFSALKADSTGRATDDINNPGNTLRSVYDNTNFPHGAQAFGYGWYGNSAYQTEFATWTPSDWSYGAPIDSITRTNVWDGNEFWLSWRQKVDPRFLPLNTVAYDSDNRYGRKVWMLQSQMTVPQQVTGGYGPGATRYSIPTTPEPVFGMGAYSFGGGLAGRGLTTNPDWSGSFQPGSAYESTAIYATGDLSPGDAWEIPSGEWVTFCLHVKPGKAWHYRMSLAASFDHTTQTVVSLQGDPEEWPTSGTMTLQESVSGVGNFSAACTFSGRTGFTLTGVAFVSGDNRTYGINSNCYDSVLARSAVLNSTFEMQACREGDSAWTTVFSKSDNPIVFGSSGPAEHTWTSALPGYNAIGLTGYLNVDLGSVPPAAAYAIDFAEVIFSKSAIAAPLAPTAPSWSFTLPAAGHIGSLGTSTFLSAVNSNSTVQFDAAKIIGTWGTAATILTKTAGTLTDIHYVVFGGGHGDTSTDGVWAWKASVGWIQLLDNSAAYTPGTTHACVDMPHGEDIAPRPASQHAYQNMHALNSDEPRGPLFLQLRGTAIGSGPVGGTFTSSQSHQLSVGGTPAWSRWGGSTSTSASSEVSAFVKDTARHLFVRYPSDNYQSYYTIDYADAAADWVTHTQSYRTGNWSNSYGACGVYDPVRDIDICGNHRGTGSLLRAIDSKNRDGAFVELTFSGTGPTNMQDTALMYRKSNGTFLLPDLSATDGCLGMFVLTPPTPNLDWRTATWAWSYLSFTGTSQYSNTAGNWGATGSYSRFQLIDKMDGVHDVILVQPTPSTPMEAWTLT